MTEIKKLAPHLLLFVLLLGVLPIAFAGVSWNGETFQVLSIDYFGCDNWDTEFTIQTTNFVSPPYRIRTVVTIGDNVHMNEDAGFSSNTTIDWVLYGTNGYGGVSNYVGFPMPAGEEVRIDFTVEKPKGNILYSWTTVLDSCDTGNITYNGETALYGVVEPEPLDPIDGACRLDIPEGSVVGEAPNGAQIYYEPDNATNLFLNPGTYIVTGQDESETYYQIVLACETRWIRKDSLQPSFAPPQNGAPLPTRIVG